MSEPRAGTQVDLVVKNPPANTGDIRGPGSIPGSGRSPGEGMATYSSRLENPTDRGFSPLSMGSQRGGSDLVHKVSTLTLTNQPTRFHAVLLDLPLLLE